ncbi:MAG: hypothetical protein K0R13_3461 [Propionibacteriaceae bacterium]|nr:hypothetical protein [Propionibacteriaceae bacterium]
MIHILELIAGIFGVGVGIWRLPDAASALEVVTPTAVGLVGLLAFVRHFLFHESDAKRLEWESIRPEFQYEVGFANLAFALVAFLAYFGGWSVAAQVAVVLGYGLYLLQAALLHTWQSMHGGRRLPRLLQSALPALAFSLLMIYLAVEAMIQADSSLR